MKKNSENLEVEINMMTYENLVAKKSKLALVGLGYVGMPIAVAFAKKVNV